jgi:pathogenesis-related protein 1
MAGKVACLALVLAMAAAAGVLITPCTAQNSAQDFVNPHNSARAAVGVGAVSWDENVAAFARSWVAKLAGDCRLVHSSGSGYGENLFGGSGADFTAADAVSSWVSEKQWYNHGSNSCASGKVCGHYTQVVWRSSTKIGCARVICNNGGIIISCNYSPPGNYVGQSPY